MYKKLTFCPKSVSLNTVSLLSFPRVVLGNIDTIDLQDSNRVMQHYEYQNALTTESFRPCGSPHRSLATWSASGH